MRGARLISDDICANCGCDLYAAKEIGESGLYNPDGPHFTLCMPCYDEEEAVTENDTNFQPRILERYYATFGLKRPKLYDIIKGEYV